MSIYTLIERLGSRGPINTHLQELVLTDDESAGAAVQVVARSIHTSGAVLDAIARKWGSEKRWGTTHPAYLALANPSCPDETREHLLKHKAAIKAITNQKTPLSERWIQRLLDLADATPKRRDEILGHLVRRGDIETDSPLGQRLVTSLLPTINDLDEDTAYALFDLIGVTTSLHAEILATSNHVELLQYLASFVEMTPEQWKHVVDVTILQHSTTNVPEVAHESIYRLYKYLPEQEKERIVQMLEGVDLEDCSRKQWLRETFLHTLEDKDTQAQRAEDATSADGLQAIVDEPRLSHAAAWAVYRHPLAAPETRVAAIMKSSHHDVDKAMKERADDLATLEAFCRHNSYAVTFAPAQHRKHLALQAVLHGRDAYRLNNNVLDLLDDFIIHVPAGKALTFITSSSKVSKSVHALFSSLTAAQLEVLQTAWSDTATLDELVTAARSCAE